MTLSPEDLQALADLASQAAQKAGALIASYTHGKVEVRAKGESAGDSLASQVVTEVDERSEETILSILVPTLAHYDLALLTEEREDDRQRFEKAYFWCIDPLDGTLPFTRGAPGYAVSIALVRKDGCPVIGVVFDPVRKRLYHGVQGAGVTIDGVAFKPSLRSDGPLKFFADYGFAKHPEREALVRQVEAVADREGLAGVEVIEGAGAVMNACQVMTDGPACYFKKPKKQQGGGSLWDFAATACLFEEAGLYARDYTGGRLELNRRKTTFLNEHGVSFASSAALAAGTDNAFV